MFNYANNNQSLTFILINKSRNLIGHFIADFAPFQSKNCKNVSNILKSTVALGDDIFQ